jgi:ABC-type multidrug transport system ATPase subunit
MIRIEKFTKRYGKFTAVDNFSLRVAEGQVFALLGPNGSGKSTILKAVVGLVKPTSGRIEVNGIDSWKEAKRAKELISYVPQRVSFHDQLSAEEVLRFYARLRGVGRDRVQEVLKMTGFNGFAGRPVAEFSGGMLQRLGLAVAYLPDTPVLVLDEPTVNLDPEGGVAFRDFVLKMKSEGKTIIFSTHVLSDVEFLADRVAVLVEGKMVALESVDTLRRHRVENARFRLVLRNPDPRFVRVAEDAGATDVSLQNDALLINVVQERRLRVLEDLEAAGAEIDLFATEPLSLQEIYMRYVKERHINGNAHE